MKEYYFEENGNGTYLQSIKKDNGDYLYELKELRKGNMKMNKIYIETTKRKFFLSYADISIIDKEEILIGFKNKNLMTFKYSKMKDYIKKFMIMI